MENISVTDIIAIVGVLVMLYKTFLSKGDKQKLRGENDKTKAETDKAEAETATAYEESLQKNLDRTIQLEKRMEDQRIEYDKKFEEQNRKILAQEKINIENEKTIKKLKRQIEKRDLIIDCLDIQYRELAQKAIDAGVKDISIDAPCFNLSEDE